LIVKTSISRPKKRRIIEQEAKVEMARVAELNRTTRILFLSETGLGASRKAEDEKASTAATRTAASPPNINMMRKINVSETEM
jgi:hypothetical protein